MGDVVGGGSGDFAAVERKWPLGGGEQRGFSQWEVAALVEGNHLRSRLSLSLSAKMVLCYPSDQQG